MLRQSHIWVVWILPCIYCMEPTQILPDIQPNGRHGNLNGKQADIPSGLHGLQPYWIRLVDVDLLPQQTWSSHLHCHLLSPGEEWKRPSLGLQSASQIFLIAQCWSLPSPAISDCSKTRHWEMANGWRPPYHWRRLEWGSVISPLANILAQSWPSQSRRTHQPNPYGNLQPRMQATGYGLSLPSSPHCCMWLPRQPGNCTRCWSCRLMGRHSNHPIALTDSTPYLVKGRRLKNDSPRIRDKYLQMYKQTCIKHKLFERATVLWKTVRDGQPLTDSQMIEFEMIDSIRTKGMNEAKKHCRKLKMGVIEWSPEIALARYRIEAWTALLRSHKGIRINSRLVCCLIKKLNSQLIKD